MSRWSDVEGNAPKEAKVYQMEFDGAYQCQKCDEVVNTAFYVPERSLLTWMCSQGHKSFVEDFSIG